MRNLYVPIDEAVVEKLLRIAAQERRNPKDQAAILIEQGVERWRPEPATPTDKRTRR